ncbi:MAG: hypothetical protein COA74_14275 [Gammaproteobacteria bacterium]|nr:MAG: hypothetical protein COA74_14275 [Gammaproteobacteria bacterium]
MKYLAVVELGDNETAFGVSVPDVEGFFSAGDTFEDALTKASEGLQSHIELLLELGGELPKPSDIGTHTLTNFGENHIVSFIDIDMNFDKKERVNISLPRHILKYMDKEVESNPKYKDRSDFIAKTALEKRYA